MNSNDINAEVARELSSMRLLGEEVCRDYKTWLDVCLYYIASFITTESINDHIARIVFTHVMTTTGQLQSVLTHSLTHSRTHSLTHSLIGMQDQT